MSEDIGVVLQDLRRDHRNMASLLRVLEQEANSIADGGTPDFELLHDIMYYMTVYPDAVHHPREDRLYASMCKLRPELSASFERIARDHRDIAELGRAVRDDLASAHAGNAVERAALVRKAFGYANALRNHMHWEEADLFQRCREMLADGQQFIDGEPLPPPGDPLFGSQLQARFCGLFERIRPRRDEAQAQ